MIELSLPVLDILWEDLELGLIPFPLEVASHGDTAEERARIRAAVYAQLASRGLTSSGRPVADLTDPLYLLAEPSAAIDLVALRHMDDPQPVRALAAARGSHAVLAVQRDLTVRLRMVRETALVESIVDLLPPCRSGPGQSIALPSSVRPTGASGVLYSATGHPGHVNDLRFVSSIMDRPPAAAGSIGVTIRDDRGKVNRLPGIGFLDTDQGRYATTLHHGDDGETWTTLSPADNHRLAHWLTESLAATPASTR